MDLAFGTPKFYTAHYGNTNRGLVNVSYNCDVKFGLRLHVIATFLWLVVEKVRHLYAINLCHAIYVFRVFTR